MERSNARWTCTTARKGTTHDGPGHDRHHRRRAWRKDANGEEFESEAREVVGEAEIYDEARDDLFEQIPAGWMIVDGLVV